MYGEASQKRSLGELHSSYDDAHGRTERRSVHTEMMRLNSSVIDRIAASSSECEALRTELDRVKGERDTFKDQLLESTLFPSIPSRQEQFSDSESVSRSRIL